MAILIGLHVGRYRPNVGGFVIEKVINIKPISMSEKQIKALTNDRLRPIIQFEQ